MRNHLGLRLGYLLHMVFDLLTYQPTPTDARLYDCLMKLERY